MVAIDWYWDRELNDPNSIWYRDKKIEDEILKLNPKAGRIVLKAAYRIKQCQLKGKRFYYTQKEFAEHEDTYQANVSYAMKVLEKLTGIFFARIPTRIVRPSCHKNSSGKWVAFPLSLMKKFCQVQVDSNKVQVNSNMVQVDSNGVQVDSNMLSINKKNNNLQTLLCLPMSYTYVLNPIWIYKEISFFIDHTNLPDSLSDEISNIVSRSKQMNEETNQTKVIRLPVKPKRFVLKTKDRPITYKDYELNPNYFRPMIHVEYKRILAESLDKLVDEDIKPLPEETLLVMKHWNEIDNPRFVSHAPRMNTATFREIQIAVSYRMGISGHSVESIINSFQNYSDISNVHRKLKYKRHLYLTGYLTSDHWFNICVGKSRDEVFKASFVKKPEFEKTYQRVIESFTKYMHHGSTKLAQNDIDGNYYRFVSFSEKMVEDHKSMNMMGKSIGEYVDMYFQFIRDFTSNWQNAPSLFVILGSSLKGQFFRQIRNEPGWENFGTEKKKKKIDTEEENVIKNS